ncbi:hypothetical protein MBLNU13_g07126t1 [Cladosporium sp. NU13]
MSCVGAKRWLRDTPGKEQWGFARYINYGDIREKFREQPHIFDNELDDEWPCLMEDEKATVRDLSGLEAQVNNDEDNELGLTADKLHKYDNMDLLKQKSLDEDFFDRFEDDFPLRAKFRILRTRFKAPCATNTKTP